MRKAYPKRTLESIEIPQSTSAVARRRCQPIVEHYGRIAGFSGQLDMNGLALSCYMQGLHDALDMVKNHPAIASPCLENV